LFRDRSGCATSKAAWPGPGKWERQGAADRASTRSEDLPDGQTIEGIRIVNPFIAHYAALIEQALGH